MILLFQSPSEMARITLAEKVVREREDWRHIPIEYLGEIVEADASLLGDLFSEEQMLLYLACQCAIKLENEEGLHSVMTCADATQFIAELRDELGETFYAIHIGEDDEQAAECDYVIDAKLSVKKASGLIGQLIDAVTGSKRKKR
jgi:hypothetical protein